MTFKRFIKQLNKVYRKGNSTLPIFIELSGCLWSTEDIEVSCTGNKVILYLVKHKQPSRTTLTEDITDRIKAY